MPVILAAYDASAEKELHSQLTGGGLHCSQLLVRPLAEVNGFVRTTECAPDVILIYMSVSLTGACQAIRDLRGTTPAPIVALGNGSGVSEVLSAVRAGASDYIILNDQLVTELNAALDRLGSNRRRTREKYGKWLELQETL